MLVITTFALMVGAATYLGEAGHASTLDPAGMFVARGVNVPTAQRDAFVACVGRSDLQRWRKLQRKGVLQAGRVFETRKVLRRNPTDQPAWNFLFFAQVRDEGVARRFSPLRRTACERAAGAQLRRVELLTATPNSVHPAPRSPRPDIIYIAEYIAVDETPEALSTYRDLMRTAQGPAVGEVIKLGQLDSLVRPRRRGCCTRTGPCRAGTSCMFAAPIRSGGFAPPQAPSFLVSIRSLPTGTRCFASLTKSDTILAKMKRARSPSCVSGNGDGRLLTRKINVV